MKKFCFLSFCTFLLTNISVSAQNIKEGPGEMPQGKLLCFEYKTNNDRNFLYESFSAKKNENGQVEVTVYDYYSKIDSLTVEADQQVLDYITEVIAKNMKIQDLRGNVPWLNGEVGQGQTHHFVAVFDSGDTLKMNGYIRKYGFDSIEKYLVDYAKAKKRIVKFEELTGDIPEDCLWHNGIEVFRFEHRSGTVEKRYKVADQEIIVVTGARSKKVLDVYVRAQSNEDLHQALVDLISGVYENEKGTSVFGTVEVQEGEYYTGDPGRHIRFVWGPNIGFDHRNEYTDTIFWGESRMQQRDYGGGRGGALSGPTYWAVKYIDEGLEVDELESGEYVNTHPDFGKHFRLKRIRGPYKHTKDVWAIASEKPLTRGQLRKLTPKQRQDMIDEINARHSDGTELTDIENLNIKLIEGMK